MDFILESIRTQEAEMLLPLFILGVVILNQILKLVMTVIRVGIVLAAVAGFLSWLPHIQ